MTPLPVAIVALTQELNFETGTTVNYLVLRLPGGGIVRAPVEDDDARRVVAAATNGVLPASATPSPAYAERTQVTWAPPAQEAAQEEDSPYIFGGEDEPVEQKPSSYVAPPPPPPAELVYTSPPRGPDGKILSPPQRTVPRDALGYPIVPRANGVDPQTILGGAHQDEDGVGSV